MKWSRNSALTVEVFPSRLIAATNVMHVCHMMEMLQSHFFQGEICNVILVADGEPDWSVQGLLNLMSLGLFWLRLELDIVVIQSYAPGHSRFNPIERYWSQLTKWLVGVTFPVDLNGVVPCDDDKESWNVVLDCAAETCTKYWNSKKITSNKVAAKTFLTSNPLVADLKATHKLLHNFVDASAIKIREDPKLQENSWNCNRKPRGGYFLPAPQNIKFV